MNPMRNLLCSVVLAACSSAPAVAALGGDAASVETDRASLIGASRVTSSVGYAMHDIQAPGGMVIREYLSPDGKVFAVSWRGQGIPDLQRILGDYYARFAQAKAAMGPHYEHHHLVIRTSGLVVQSRGHTRDFFGRAWVPALLPKEFLVSQIN
jgi:uncharacterized protein DUF2844